MKAGLGKSFIATGRLIAPPQAPARWARSADLTGTRGPGDRRRRWQVVDQHHGPRAIPAEIVADRGTLPEHFQIAGILGVEHALAIAQAPMKAPPASSPST
jgi:hypothetical protein